MSLHLILLFITALPHHPGRDSGQQDLQSSGCEPGERAADGGLWETSQWCEHTPLSLSFAPHLHHHGYPRTYPPLPPLSPRPGVSVLHSGVGLETLQWLNVSVFHVFWMKPLCNEVDFSRVNQMQETRWNHKVRLEVIRLLREKNNSDFYGKQQKAIKSETWHKGSGFFYIKTTLIVWCAIQVWCQNSDFFYRKTNMFFFK